MKNFKEFILELFFPSFCLGCKKERTFLCYDCKSTLEISEYNYCLCNKDPLRLPKTEDTLNLTTVQNRVLPNQGENGKCNRCQAKKLSGLYSALPYKEKFLTKKLIHNFKYKPWIKTLAKPLADIILEHLFLAKNLETHIWENSIIIPVPLQKSKWKDRGYNQSEELARELGHILNVLLVLDNLVKIKKTLPQMELSAKDRQENLMGAFIVKNPDNLAGKKIFLADDVYTTGSTMEECAKTLKEAGAKQVWGIVIAREG